MCLTEIKCHRAIRTFVIFIAPKLYHLTFTIPVGLSQMILRYIDLCYISSLFQEMSIMHFFVCLAVLNAHQDIGVQFSILDIKHMSEGI